MVPVYYWQDSCGANLGLGTRFEFDFHRFAGNLPEGTKIGPIVCHEPATGDIARRSVWPNGDTFERLTAEYERFLSLALPQAARDELPENGKLSADELAHELFALIDETSREEIQPLCNWLGFFIERWERLENV